MMPTLDIATTLSNKSVVLVGAGQLGQMALDLWPESLPKPELILDAHREGSLGGIPIEKTIQHKPSAANVYVLSFFKESAEKVRELYHHKFHQEIITVYDLLTHFNADRFSNGWSGAKTQLPVALKNLQYFRDDHSRAVYQAAVEWRYNRNLVESYPVSQEASKYDIRKYISSESVFDFVVDGGSYDFSFGTTLANTGATWKSLVAFEPDPSRLKILMNAVTALGRSHGEWFQVALDQRALWSSGEGSKFYSNGLLSARIARSPDETCVSVKTVTLSSVFDEFQVSPRDKCLIKLHVEGAEWPVIEASKELLESDINISLLINLSHDEDSLVQIPRMFGETGKYHLYLESHSLFGEGLTLFANRQEK